MATIPAPHSEPAREQPEQTPFLKAVHIGKVGTTAKITIDGRKAIVVDGNYGQQLIVTASYKKADYKFGINLGTPNHKILFEKFGKNSAKWRGPVTVKVAQGVSNPYLIVVD